MAPTMTAFCKNEECPSSTELVDYQSAAVGKTRRGEICRHLSVCEFCEAEAEFYSTYPQAADENGADAAAVDIPAPLFELAEALLRNRHLDGGSLNSLLKERRKHVRHSV